MGPVRLEEKAAPDEVARYMVALEKAPVVRHFPDWSQVTANVGVSRTARTIDDEEERTWAHQLPNWSKAEVECQRFASDCE